MVPIGTDENEGCSCSSNAERSASIKRCFID